MSLQDTITFYGNIKPDRTRARDKVDLVAATINALACVVVVDAEDKESVYEERGLRNFD